MTHPAAPADPLDVFPVVSARRRVVADLLETLDEAQLAAPSLCGGWDVRTVAAHLADAAAPALSPFLWALVRAGGRVHLANDRAAREAGRRPVAETVALLRERAESRFTPPVTGQRAVLAEVLVHEADMRIPLGLPVVPDPAAARVVLGFLTTGRPVGFVPRGRLRGLRLVATDVDWAWGRGAEVRGASSDLVLAACGRTAALPRLQGPGVPVLIDRT